jgi:zinc and cadmium transporter
MSAYAAAFLVASVSSVGLLLGSFFFETFISKRLTYLVSFSAGVFAFSSLNLFIESLEISSIYITGAGFLVGFLFFLFFDQVIFPESHHHHDDNCDHGHKNTSAVKMLIGDAVHNVADGIILASAFFVSTSVGVITMVGILIHELLQETSEYFVLIHAGYTKSQAVFRNILVSLTVFIGVFAATKFIVSDTMEAVLLSVSAGAFLYIVFHDLVPRESLGKTAKITHVIAFVAGILLLFLVSALLPHTH